MLSGMPVIYRATALYGTLSIVVTAGLAAHHAGDAQNLAGRIAVIARWWVMHAGMPPDRCHRKLRPPKILLPLAAAIVVS